MPRHPLPSAVRMASRHLLCPADSPGLTAWQRCRPRAQTQAAGAWNGMCSKSGGEAGWKIQSQKLVPGKCLCQMRKTLSGGLHSQGHLVKTEVLSCQKYSPNGMITRLCNVFPFSEWNCVEASLTGGPRLWDTGLKAVRPAVRTCEGEVTCLMHPNQNEEYSLFTGCAPL